MAKVKSESSSKPIPKIRPAINPESRQNQMIDLAMNLVEKRLLDGSATSQETVHFLKLGTAKARAETEILEMQKALIAAKTEALQSEKRREELYVHAIKAMRRYSGNGGHDDDDEDIPY